MRTTLLSGVTSGRNSVKGILLIVALVFCANFLHAQCEDVPGTISGTVYLEASEQGAANVLVKAINSSGEIAAQEMTDFFGNYVLGGLSDQLPYRVEFVYGGNFSPAIHGDQNETSVQFVSAPKCGVNFSLIDPVSYCSENAQIALTCFVRGGAGENDMLETIVNTDFNFGLDSKISKFSNKLQTGSVWGLTWKSSTRTLFSSAFVKQYAALTSHGHGAIFTTDVNTGSTELFTSIDDLGQDIGDLIGDQENINYGAQAGKMGLGGIEISDDEEKLYVVNIYNNTLVALSSSNPTTETTEAFSIPDPGCLFGDTYKAFALTKNNGKFYVGVTCTSLESGEAGELSVTVFEFDPTNSNFTSIFTTDYPKGYWLDTPANSTATQAWLTDLDFTDEGNMILSLSDRIAHRYANLTTNGRLDDQHPDILLAYQEGGEWKLEQNAKAGSLIGSHPNAGEGPGNGEFFGYDYWISGPNYHSEIATGSVMVLPGTGSVVATVFDPDFDSYTGGLHKYSTSNGDKLGVAIVYEHENDLLFGKASGLGDIVSICAAMPLEIGNMVWNDANNNGIQDAGEEPLAGIELSLYDDNCTLVGTTTTNNKGNYYFNDSNVDLNQDGLFDGLNLESNYTLVITDTAFDTQGGILVVGGNPFIITKKSLGSGTNSERNDSDATIAAGICTEIDGRPYVSVRTGKSGETNHSSDFGFSPAAGFDLALRKELISDFAVQYGDTAVFKITVFNQGGVGAEEVFINDYLTPAYIFDETLNPGWKVKDGIAQTILGSSLLPGAETTVLIQLIIADNAKAGELINYAEIGLALNAKGEPLIDVDSQSDDIADNDIGGVIGQASDDEINDDGTFDEDDHDPATVGLYDLALRKVLVNQGEGILPNSAVDFQITVYNQGNIAAKSVTISDYLSKDLIFNPDINPGWVLLDDSTVIYTINDEIAPLSSRSVALTLEVGNINSDVDLVNYAEIRSSVDIFGQVGKDVDSQSDGDRNNDIGGSPYDLTDNEINDDGSIDEDDHDPALLNFSVFDLALIKTTLSTSVKAGQEVTFSIEIINQGDVAAEVIGIVDYIPEHLKLNDADWEMIEPSKAKKQITVPGGLQPGNSFVTTVTMTVSEEFMAGTLINFAEIESVYAADGKALSESDVDSSPDNLLTNTLGGLPFSPSDFQGEGFFFEEEDDHYPASVYVFASLVDETCICLENATVDEEGQFGEIIEIIAPSDLEWYIEQVEGLFDADISPMSPPTGSDFPKGMQYPLTPFVTGVEGYQLLEYPIGSTGNSRYFVTGVRLDGEQYTIVLRNNVGDQEIINGNACNYQSNEFVAPAGVCSGAIENFCIEGFDSNAMNEWTVTGDATIIGASNEECVQVQFGSMVGSDVEIVFNNNSTFSCYSPSMQTVTIGESSGALSCLGSVNVSLNNQCELGLTPEALLTSPITAGSVYSIIYTTAEGWMLPDDVDWNNYIDREIVAKVMDNCSGNSCWSFITIEDKRAPEIECFDLTVSCIEMMDYNGPFVLDNCSGEGTLIPTTQSSTALECDPDFSYILKRGFRAQDDLGNMSAECMQTIYVERPDLDAIVAPANYTVEGSNALACSGFDEIDGGVPDPSVYGVPTLEGQPLYPGSGQFCNLGVAYKDTKFPANGCVQKIMRQWYIFEWHCEFGNMDTITQIFNIADMEAPAITCGSDIEVSTNSSTCFGDINLPPAIISDDCTDNPTVNITYPGGFLEDSNGGKISLPIGIHEVTYTVVDDCFNSNSCSIKVEVEDNTPPIAVCHQNTVLSVRNDGTTYAFASSFDDGSFDDCGFDRIEVRRMDGGAACSEDDGGAFSDRVEFCCADVGEETVVVLRVFDLQGNSNECMVNVQIQDKNPPIVVAPADMTVDCEEVIELNDLSRFGEATASDNCMNTTISEQVISNLTECRTGTIQRIFIASDGNGSATDFQIITVVTEDTFDIDNISWPEDYETNADCDPGSLKPENLPEPYRFPILDEGFCSQVAITYSDKVFDILNSETACQKIIRSWIVEDFCQPADVNRFESWRYDQVIVIANDVAPVITSNCDDITVCSFNENCSTGPVTLTAGASDDCTPGNMMRYTYFIDFDDNGSLDVQDSGTGDSITVMGEYPIGTHSIIYRFADLCGNTITCNQRFTIQSCVGPTVVCHDGISVGLEPMDTDGDGEVDDEMAVVCAKIFDASSFHPCGDELIFSFSEDPADTCRTFACDDIGLNDVSIYAIDESGVVDFCITTLDVQDNNQVDLCRGVEECIVMPTDITVTECVDDFSPEIIGGGPMIDPECICTMTTIDFVDRDSSAVDNTCTFIIRDWTVTFTCGFPKAFTSTQLITKFNDAPPIVDCPTDVSVDASGSECEGFVEVGVPVVLSDCSTDFTITNDSQFADSNTGAASGTYPVGTTVVTYSITDICENTSTCEVTVTVSDDASPICEVVDITIGITDPLIDVTVNADMIDNGSSDACGLVVDRVLVPDVFGCDDAGTVQDVTLTITDDSGNSTDCFAQITVVDSVAPICVTRPAIVNLFDDASVTVPASAINNGSFDECGILVDVISESSFDCSALGDTTAILVLIDDSGNRTECEVEVTVRDLGVPECILQPIEVSLDGSDQAVITGQDIDNGSSDNCSGLDTLILDRTTFTCDDIGDVTVNVVAIDIAGNSTNCETVVTVTSSGMLMCVANDVTIFLGENGEANITAGDIDGGSGVACAEDAMLSLDRTTFFCNDVGIEREVTLSITSSLGDTSCTAMVMVLDTIPPVVNCPIDLTVDCQDLSDDLSVYGTVNTMGSNCLVLLEDISVVDTIDLNDCGLGEVTRTFTAVDVNGNSNSCTQTITVVNGNSFNESDIVWPADTLTIEQCISIDPDSIDSRPSINMMTEACTNIGVNYVDDNFTMSETCQDSIRRTWTVIDSCPTPFSMFTFEQIIVISDDVAPIVTIADTLFLCDTVVSYTFEVTDCNDVMVDYTSSAASGTGTTISGIFPEGNTTVGVVATDRCGNFTEDSVVVNIVLDTVPPELICINRTIRIEEDGETQVLPSDPQWFLSVTDDATAPEDLMYSFNPEFDMTTDTLIFTCDSVIIKSHTLDIFVKDKGGNVSTCTASYVTTDPNGVCSGNLAVIQGLITTEMKQEIAEVKVNLVNGDMAEMTNLEGFYTFPEMNGDKVYELKPEKNTNHMAGVTTLDLVLIQRHILGTQRLGSAYQLIAADINKSGVVSGKDLLDLKKNILDLVDGFPNNTSWRFIDGDYEFIDAENPFNEYFPESYMIYDMKGPVYKDFIGVKIGDVNGSVQLKQNQIASSRSLPFVIEAEDVLLNVGEEVSVPLTSAMDLEVAGLQMSFILDDGLELNSIESDLFDISSSDYSITQFGSQQVITLALVPKKDVRVEEGLEILRFNLASTARIQLVEKFDLNNNFSNEVYGSDLHLRELELKFGALDEEHLAATLLQNTPNPWKDKTVIAFSLPKAQLATINVYNVNGALITSITDQFVSGSNEVELKANKFNESGVYYYELITDTARVSKRMILIR